MISPGMQSCEHSLNTLRYADRVKELGAENPETKNGDEYEEEEDENGDEEDDLALLHNSNVAFDLDKFNLILINYIIIYFFCLSREANCQKICTHSTRPFHICKRWKKKFWTFINSSWTLSISGLTITTNCPRWHVRWITTSIITQCNWSVFSQKSSISWTNFEKKSASFDNSWPKKSWSRKRSSSDHQ